jgi:CO/xanthine dehydrogenase Mo-binding subunit
MAEKPRSGQPIPFGAGHKLIGYNYSTTDLEAKVTGRAKYAEDLRAEGMLFCRLVHSPVPRGRVRHIDASEALKMPGVRAVFTADDMPPQADYMDDFGQLFKANPWGERALTNEPRFQGDPILAVAAIDELTCAEAIEKIHIDIEPLPFVIDPLETLRPGSPNPHKDGNVWAKPDPPDTRTQIVRELKWTAADFAEYSQGRLPQGHAPDEWTYGDLDAGFKNAALVLDESFVTPDVSHHCLEPRTAMAWWQGGKLFLSTGTQSTKQTASALSRWMRMPIDNIVFISEYTGGGFGSKLTGGLTMIIPALLSKKLNAPVQMRFSREDELLIGRARPSLDGRMKVGFSKDGRITALDMLVICNNGAYESQGDANSAGRIVSLIYQPEAMRWRGVTVMTNTPTRSAQSAPGGMQGVAILEPILAKAARKLNLDHVAIHRINTPDPETKPHYNAAQKGKRPYATSCFLRHALDRGAEQFKWAERVALPKRSGTKARGLGVAISSYSGGSVGFDGLIVITPEGRVRFHTGIGNLGTASVIDVHRAGAEFLGVPWEQCDIVWGDTAHGLPYSCISGGSQTTHAMTRASFAAATAARERMKEIAALTHGGKPESYDVANGHIVHKGGGPVMTFAEAARKAIALGGVYDGHTPPDSVHKLTQTAVRTLAGQGLVVAAKDTFPHDGDTFSYVASFAEVEIDLETGKYLLTDFLVYGDVGTVVHPAALGGQMIGRSILGIGHAIGQKWVFDPEYGRMLGRRFYQSKPPTILDVPTGMQWNALNIPDPETPIGARGVGEPPVGGGCASILNAISDALGDNVFRRAPVNLDTILTSLEEGHPTQHPLMAHI